MRPELETARFLLKPLATEDAEEIQEIFRRWEIVKYLTRSFRGLIRWTARSISFAKSRCRKWRVAYRGFEAFDRRPNPLNSSVLFLLRPSQPATEGSGSILGGKARV
jgi:hypothetical protein